ncbi:restriction endonuclease [Pseudoalteromonas sp. OFAV1]|uniref:restriction endonuclease n=1 Tax=Pseudoalteromonas sp. OFAV1 TaxID=2908892 RepID=UPI001F200393|nr:restriction endonuclease [Pseudoalteromonas sp. OFAV1]MCF2902600.1 restriction endonuclease [Pseudoalteromonas sp. OFAV1]
MSIKFTRTARTSNSESYALFQDDHNVGSLDIHFSDCVYGTLIFTKEFSNEEHQEIFARIEDELVDPVPRADFIFSVYQGKEIGMYSDSITEEDRAYEPVKKRDLEDISKLVKSAVGKKRNIQGKLTEHISVEFFESLGYRAKRGDSELDHMKIDVVAESDEELVLVQVKSGSIGLKQIENAVESISKYPSSKQNVAAFIANDFPVRAESLRKALGCKYGMQIQYYHTYQILKNLPEYKSSL